MSNLIQMSDLGRPGPRGPRPGPRPGPRGGGGWRRPPRGYPYPMYPYPYWMDPIIIVETPTPLVEDAVDVEYWGDDELGMGQNDVPPASPPPAAPPPPQSKLFTAGMIVAGVVLGGIGMAAAKRLIDGR